MRKIKKRWLMLSMVALAPIVFTASCSLVKVRDDQKFDYSNSKILKGKIIKFEKDFDFHKNFKTAGILQSVADFDNLVDNIDIRSWNNKIDQNILNSKKRFINLFKDKYNQKFFETKNVIFYQEHLILRIDFLDSVIQKNNQIYVNYVSVDILNGKISDAPVIDGLGTENKIYFAEIPKQRNSIRVNLNRIYTLEAFKNLKNKNFYEGYGINDSREENKNNYKYEDLK